MSLVHKGNYFSFEYCYSHSFFPIWSLSCKGWGLLFQLNLMGDKIICKDSSDAKVFKLQCYSGRKILNQYRLAQLIKKSQLVALHTHTERTSENQFRIYWLFLLLLLLFANSTTIFLSSFITLSLLFITLPEGLLFYCLLLAVWSSYFITGLWKAEGQRRSTQAAPRLSLPESKLHFEIKLNLRHQIWFLHFSFIS